MWINKVRPLRGSCVKSPLCLVAETVSHNCLTSVHMQTIQTLPFVTVIPFLVVQSTILYIQVECDYLCVIFLLVSSLSVFPSTQYLSIHVDAGGELIHLLHSPHLYFFETHPYASSHYYVHCIHFHTDPDASKRKIQHLMSVPPLTGINTDSWILQQLANRQSSRNQALT